MTALQPWQEALKRIEGSSAQEELADQLEQEFTRIGAKQKLTKADWISVAAIMASHLVRANAVNQAIPDMAAGLVKLGASKSGKPGSLANAEKRARLRQEVGEWLLSAYTPDSFAKRGALTTALHEAREKFCGGRFKLSEKTFSRIAREVGLKK